MMTSDMFRNERPDYMRDGPMVCRRNLASILSTWSDREWRRCDGVQLDRLEHMQRIVVRTYQHAYEIFVRSGGCGRMKRAAANPCFYTARSARARRRS